MVLGGLALAKPLVMLGCVLYCGCSDYCYDSSTSLEAVLIHLTSSAYAARGASPRAAKRIVIKSCMFERVYAGIL